MNDLQPLAPRKGRHRLWVKVAAICVVLGIVAGLGLASVLGAIDNQGRDADRKLCAAVNANRATILEIIDRSAEGTVPTEGLSDELRQLIELSRQRGERFRAQARIDLAPLPCQEAST